MTQFEDVWPFPRDRSTPILPPPRLHELRGDDELTRIRMYDGTSTVILTSYDDVKQLVASPDVSSDGRRPGFPYMSEASRVNRGGKQSIDRLDPPTHDEQRAMLATFFSFKRIREMRPFIEETVDELLDAIAARGGSADLVADFAEPLPALAIAKLLDLPPADIPFFFDHVKTWMDEKADPADIRAAMAAVGEYFAGIIDERGCGEGTDVLSQLVRGQVLTGALSREDLLLAMQLLVKAGFDTSANMIAIGTAVLLEHPDQWRELVETEDPVVVQGAVEELLRYISVAQHSLMRLTTADVPVGHHVIPADTAVMASIAAANHDPAAWDAPDVFDIHREARGHVAFGIGLHQCLGQALARLELQAVFTKLPRRFPDLSVELASSDLPFRDSVVFGIESLPVRWAS